MSHVARTLLLLASLWLTAPALAQGADIEVELDQFGVGSAFRPGEFVGVRIKLTSHRDEPATPVWVQLEVPNADGDIGEYGRSTTLNRETPKFIWLYAPLPANAEPGGVWTVRVFEERDGRRRQELGGSRIAAPSGGFVEIAAAMIGVVSDGNSRMGLDDYGVMGAARQIPVSTHEPHRVVTGITPLKLPDRWEGLKGFEAMVWSDADPGELREETATALVEYVRRAGI